MGTNATANGNESLALEAATANGTSSIAIGNISIANGNQATALGTAALADNTNSNAIGYIAQATGENSNAIGAESTASGMNATALGTNATASGSNSIALGTLSSASTDNSVAIGANAVTGAAHTGTTAQSVTLRGNTYTYAGVASDANGTVSVGAAGAERQIQNVAAGDVSAASTDAVNGSQLYATNQAIETIKENTMNLDNRLDKVGAGAAALAALHPLDFDPDDKWDFAAGYGNYRSANAAAIGIFYRPNEDTMFSIGGSFGGGENMVNAGLSIKLGQGNHISTSRVAMAKEMKSMRKEIESLRSALTDVSAGRQLDPIKMKLFPDVPQNHWAYKEIATLAGNGMLEGYPDGDFKGDRMMTRYEYATVLYRAMQNGATVSQRLLNEFEPELERVRIDVVSKHKNGTPDIERVRVIPGRA
jgi:hypothetical protein